jgi:membrane protease YdiL (CAAX protease family)
VTKQTKKDQKDIPLTGPQLWKIIGMFALVYAVVQVAIGVIGAGEQFLMDAVNAGNNLRIFVGSTISHAGMVAVILLVTIPVIRSVFKKPGLEGLYPTSGKQWKEIFIGMAIASLAMLIIFLLEYALGFVRFSGFALQGQSFVTWLRTAWLALLVTVVTAINEEVLFRGLLLQGIEISWDKWGALFISSIIFGGSHILATGANESNWLDFIPLLALPGVMLGWAYLRTGNLWLATGIHFAWNLFQNDILNLTGIYGSDTHFGLETSLTGPAWAVGTSYGIEVGAAGIFGLLLVCAGIWWWTQLRNKALSE